MWSASSSWGPSVPAAAEQWIRPAGVVYLNAAVGPHFSAVPHGLRVCAPPLLQDVAPPHIPWAYDLTMVGASNSTMHAGIVVQRAPMQSMAPPSVHTLAPSFLERKLVAGEDNHQVTNLHFHYQNISLLQPMYPYDQEQKRFPCDEDETDYLCYPEQQRFLYEHHQHNLSYPHVASHTLQQNSASVITSHLGPNIQQEPSQPDCLAPDRNTGMSSKGLYSDSSYKQLVQQANKKSKSKKQKSKSPAMLDQQTVLVHKNYYERQMQDFIKSTFPDFLSSVVTVPPLHFKKTKYKRLERHSTSINEVVQQVDTQPSDVSGDKTDEFVIQCIVRLVKAMPEPVIVLTNYVFDNYLSKTTKDLEKQAHHGFRCHLSAEETATQTSDLKKFLETSQSSCSGDASILHGATRNRSSFLTVNARSGSRQHLRSVKERLQPKEVFPTPGDLAVDLRRGDFDILVISRKCGFVIIETKSMDSMTDLGGSQGQGRTESQSSQSSEEMEQEDEKEQKRISNQGKHKGEGLSNDDIKRELDADSAMTSPACQDQKEMDMIKNKVTKALQQLKKAEEVLHHLVSDFPEGDRIPVRKVLAFPKTRQGFLRGILEDARLADEFCTVLGACSLEHALSRCLCMEDAKKIEDDLKMAPWESEQTSPKDGSLLRWWSNVIGDHPHETDVGQPPASCTKESRGRSAENESGSCQVISQDTYERLFARFCGPYSKVSIECRKNTKNEARTVADCIHLTGLRFGRSILREAQVDILNNEDRFVCLTGPPGSGKTLVLGLKAVEWAKSGHRVIIIGAHKLRFGALVSSTLFRQVQENALEAFGNVCLEKISLSTDVDAFVRHLLDKYQGRGLKIIVDECPWIATMKEQERRLESCIKDLKAIIDLYRKLLDTSKLVKTSYASTPVRKKHYLNVLSTDKALYPAAVEVRKSQQKKDVISTSLSCPPKHQQKKDVISTSLSCPPKHQMKRVPVHVGISKRPENVTYSAVPEQFPSKMKAVPVRCRSKYDGGLLPAHVYFRKMENHLQHTGKRLSFLRTGKAGPRLISMDKKWGSLVLEVARLDEEIKGLKAQAEGVLCGCSAGQVDEESATVLLDEVDKRMLSAMGFMFHFNTSLYFFHVQKLMQTVSKVQQEGENLDVALWTSSAFSNKISETFIEKKLELSLRCPPAIQELLKQLEGDLMIEQPPPQYTYQTRTFEVNPPLPTVGLEVMLLDHGNHLVSVKEVNDCPECGEALASYLLDTLRVGVGNLRPRDVIISGSPVHSERCALLEQLRQKGLPALTESQLDTTAAPFPDKILVIGGNFLQGLESKIVVYVPEVNRVPASEDDGTVPDNGDARPDLPEWLQRLGRWNRSYLWFVASRTLSHLIVFKI